MALKFRPEDATAFKLLGVLVALYAAMAWGVYHIIHMRHVAPLAANAPPQLFSEARAIEHVRQLTLHGRQEGQPGLELAADYIKGQLGMIALRAGPEYKVEIEETLVNGSFNMTFLRHSVTLGYRNHKNIVMRISSKYSRENDPSVLVNGHFDSPLGSPGAGDCGSCVASMLELSRQIIDSNWIPSKPIIFLFNGAEELFLLGSHGFAKGHKWRNSIGAFINIEASGTGGFDLVCQSGPGFWPSLVYAKSAVFPMANSAAQDVFGIIPGDTDYRIFAKDYGNIPGLDIIFVLGGYYYHTSYDTLERLLPGSIQARGENVISLIKAFASSSELQNADQRFFTPGLSRANSDRAIYFDYFSLFMIFYSRKVSIVLHSLPLLIFLLIPMLLHFPVKLQTCFAAYADLMKGLIFHLIGVILAIVVPISFAVLRLLFSSYGMSWFAHPYLAFLMFVPSSLVGLLIPKALWGFFPLSQDANYVDVAEEVLSDEAHFWGAFGLYAFTTVIYLVKGLGGGFLTFLISVSMLLAWFSYSLTRKYLGKQSLCSLAGYLIPLVPSLLYTVYFSGFLVQFLIEKMGMMGALALPQPYGYFVPDVIVAAVVGIVTGWCVGPLVPVLGRRLAKPSILQFLLQMIVLSLALSSQFFPYTIDAPKRVVLQHTIVTKGANNIVETSYDFSVVDANSLVFLFKYAPEAAKALDIGPDLSFEAANHSDMSSFAALFPVSSSLFSDSLKFNAPREHILKHYQQMPMLNINEVTTSANGARRADLELDLGSLEEIWVTALNITGPLSNWSFADNIVPAPEEIRGGPPSYIVRLSGKGHENWTFWLEANSSEALRIDVAVLDQYLTDDTKKLKNLFPSWADLVTFTTFFSSYSF